jgi:VWFA-related protein
MRTAAFPLLVWLPLCAQIRLLVTVVEQRSGRPVAALQAGDFSVFDDKTPRPLLKAEFASSPIDVMLLLDTSLVGGMVQPVAFNLIDQLQEKEQMAVVSFADSARLIQDFSSARPALRKAVAEVRYGNEPRVLDALYAAIDGGFEHATFRRVLLLLTTGVEGYSRTPERDVVALARRAGVSIYPVYFAGAGRSLLENLARRSGGASFNLRDLGRDLAQAPPGARIFETLRAHYTLTVSGSFPPGEKLRVEVKGRDRLQISAAPLE